MAALKKTSCGSKQDCADNPAEYLAQMMKQGREEAELLMALTKLPLESPGKHHILGYIGHQVSFPLCV